MKGRRIKSVGEGLRATETNRGPRVPWKDDVDNPLSPAFVPLTERGERDKSRWWALSQKRARTHEHGEYDPK